MKKRLHHWYQTMRQYADRWWYAPLIGALAFADLFVIVIPTDGLLISAVMLAPRRWFTKSVIVALGSSLGAVALVFLLHEHGLPLLLKIAPGIDQSHAWIWSQHLMEQWGIWALFLIGVSPFMQHPAIALAALAHMPVWSVFWAVFIARVIKYAFLGWIATHAPKMLERLWGLDADLKEIGVNQDPDAPKLP